MNLAPFAPIIPFFVMFFGYKFGMMSGTTRPKVARRINPQDSLVPHVSPEDRTIMILRSEYVNDRLSLEEFDEGVGLALQGQGFKQITGRRRPLVAAAPEELGDYNL